MFFKIKNIRSANYKIPHSATNFNTIKLLKFFIIKISTLNCTAYLFYFFL